MKKFLDFYHRTDKIVFFAVVISLVLMLMVINIFAIYWSSLPSQIPLFYSLPWGDSQLAAIPQFVILPFIILLNTLINLLLSWQLHDSQNALKRLFCGASLVVAILITITALKIVFIYV